MKLKQRIKNILKFIFMPSYYGDDYEPDTNYVIRTYRWKAVDDDGNEVTLSMARRELKKKLEDE